jgi:hypothetical protein
LSSSSRSRRDALARNGLVNVAQLAAEQHANGVALQRSLNNLSIRDRDFVPLHCPGGTVR